MPFPDDPNILGARVAAKKIIKKYSLDNPQDILLEDIAMALGVFVLDAPLKGAEARLTRKKDKGIIRVKENISNAGKRRFAIAHELGHWERHASISQLFLCDESNLSDYSKSNPEIEANAFAGELLVPSSMCSRFCLDSDPSLDVVKEIGDFFDVSLTVAAIRYIEECDTKCFVVFSENRQIKWWRRSKEAEESKIWIDARQPLHRNSMAWECFNNPETKSSIQEVDTDIWISQQRKKRNYTLYEQSNKLGQYPTVLTFLWLIEEEWD